MRGAPSSAGERATNSAEKFYLRRAFAKLCNEPFSYTFFRQAPGTTRHGSENKQNIKSCSRGPCYDADALMPDKHI
jgi:hypothetical protein